MVAATVVATGCGVDTSRVLSPEGCTNKTAVDADLHVDSADPRTIWAIDRQTGTELSLRIPGGYGVAEGQVGIIDPGDHVIGRTGDHIVSGCTDVIQHALMIDESDIRRSGA
jgi:hypothetical protein